MYLTSMSYMISANVKYLHKFIYIYIFNITVPLFTMVGNVRKGAEMNRDDFDILKLYNPPLYIIHVFHELYFKRKHGRLHMVVLQKNTKQRLYGENFKP